MTYAEKLKDPRWQKKRLEVMQRDQFTCQLCKQVDKTLHVHHKTYTYGNDPWDYNNNNFITYCYECHELEEFFKITFNDLVHDMLVQGYNYKDLHIILWDNFNNI